MMRAFVIAVTVTATVAFGAALAWQANAAAPASPVPVAGPYTPIHPAACYGSGYCAPGRHRVCGPYGNNCWCAPC
jgi:hypothetical protein